jgi:hypothetical protein
MERDRYVHGILVEQSERHKAMKKREAEAMKKSRRIPRADHWPTGDLIGALLVAVVVFVLVCSYLDVPLVDLPAFTAWAHRVADAFAAWVIR